MKFYKNLPLLFITVIPFFSHTNLLIKIATHHNPQIFFHTLNAYYNNISKTIPYHFLITCDSNDTSMNNAAVIEQLTRYENLSYRFIPSCAYAEMYNDGLTEYPFDICILASDAAEPCLHFDTTIMNAMREHFPDFDGIINAGTDDAPVHALGTKFFHRYGYAYNPAYRSCLATQELTLISRILKKEKIFHSLITQHMPNSLPSHIQDTSLFNSRQSHFFGLEPSTIDATTPKLWSILICTLEERAQQFNALYTKLQNQISALGLNDSIEILYFKDNRQKTVGFKRNALLHASQGKYVCFIDDDDDVHDRYIYLIYQRLLKNPDCVGLTGIMTFNHDGPKKCFIHSLKYDTYFEEEATYFRPPNHLNPMRRAIAIQCAFPEKNHTEDLDWTMKITQTKLLKTEEFIKAPCYFYNYMCYK